MTREERIKFVNELGRSFRPVGRVVTIKESPQRKKELFVTLRPLANQHPGGKQDSLLAVPVSKKLPTFIVKVPPFEYLEDIKNKKNPNQRYYMAKFVAWNAHKVTPLCEIVSCIGEAGNLEAETIRILKSFDIVADEYEPSEPIGKTGEEAKKQTEDSKSFKAVEETLKVFMKDIDDDTGEWKIPPNEMAARLDLRKTRIFTIDPITAKDLDDALSIRHVEGSLYEIGVHIADVSYFVQQGTELDKEAQLRCTTVYFVHKVWPMLPRLLC